MRLVNSASLPVYNGQHPLLGSFYMMLIIWWLTSSRHHAGHFTLLMTFQFPSHPILSLQRTFRPVLGSRSSLEPAHHPLAWSCGSPISGMGMNMGPRTPRCGEGTRRKHRLQKWSAEDQAEEALHLGKRA